MAGPVLSAGDTLMSMAGDPELSSPSTGEQLQVMGINGNDNGGIPNGSTEEEGHTLEWYRVWQEAF